MSTSLTTRGRGGGMVPAVASAVVPGLGQLINGDGTKALGVFLVALVTGYGVSLPIVGGISALIFLATWIYGVGDSFAGKR